MKTRYLLPLLAIGGVHAEEQTDLASADTYRPQYDFAPPPVITPQTPFGQPLENQFDYQRPWVNPSAAQKRQHQHHPPAANRGQHRQPRRPRARPLPPARQQPLRRGASLPPTPGRLQRRRRQARQCRLHARRRNGDARLRPQRAARIPLGRRARLHRRRQTAATPNGRRQKPNAS